MEKKWNVAWALRATSPSPFQPSSSWFDLAVHCPSPHNSLSSRHSEAISPISYVICWLRPVKYVRTWRRISCFSRRTNGETWLLVELSFLEVKCAVWHCPATRKLCGERAGDKASRPSVAVFKDGRNLGPWRRGGTSEYSSLGALLTLTSNFPK